MGLNRTSTRMIENPVKKGTTLYDHLISVSTVTVCDFGYKEGQPIAELLHAVDEGIKFLRNRKFGTLEIVPVPGFSETTCYVDAIKHESAVKLRYRQSYYRYPIEGGRPIGGDYREGDIVYNTNVSKNPELGWVCVEAGSPGVWKPYDFIKMWYSEVERLDHLPTPGPLQEGRQIYLADGKSFPRVFVCKQGLDKTYQWNWMVDFTYGTTEERPTSNITIGQPHYNTDLATYQWWNGEDWVTVLEDGITGSLEDLYTSDKSSLVNAINELCIKIGAGGSTPPPSGDGSEGNVGGWVVGPDLVGPLSELPTQDKSNVVNAIKEIHTNNNNEFKKVKGNIGSLDNLPTTNKGSLVEAISEVSTNTANSIKGVTDSIGSLSSLPTTNKSNLVSAITELSEKKSQVPNLGSLEDLNTKDKSSLVNAINEVSDYHLRVPMGQPVPRQNVVGVLSHFDTKDVWKTDGTAGWNLRDTVDFITGKQSISVIPTGSTTHYSCSTSITRTDLTGKAVRIRLKCKNPATIGSIYVQLSNTDTFGSNQSFYIYPEDMIADEWMEFTMNFINVANTGYTYRDAVYYVRVSISGLLPSNKVSIDAIELVPESDNAYVSIVFTGSAATSYDIARPLLESYGYRATIYPTIEDLDTPGNISTEQLKRLYEFDKWEVGVRSFSSELAQRGFTDVPISEVKSDLICAKSWLHDKGIRGVSSVLYPKNKCSGKVIETIKPYFSSGIVTGRSFEAPLPSSPYRLRAVTNMNLHKTTVESAITKCHNFNPWIILVFDKIVASNATASDTYLEYSFKLLLNRLRTAVQEYHIQVLPVSEVLSIPKFR